MLRWLWAWLGAARAWTLVITVIAVIVGSVIAQLAIDDVDRWLSVQLALVGVLIAVLGIVFSGRISPQARRRLLIALGPGLLLIALGVIFPSLALFFGGAGVGWMLMSQFVLRGRVRMEYQAAVKHMRRGDYDAAIDVMGDVICAEPENAEHYRFRAELFRLAGKTGPAADDYQRVTELEPEATAGYTGLAEIAMQDGKYEQAYDYARQAARHDPHGWMPVYNLGMIADRRAAPDDAVTYLEQALARRIPQSRYRLMTYLWLARNYHRLGRTDDAVRAVERMRKESGGLREWEIIMQSNDSGPLHELLAGDVVLAQQLVESSTPLDVLAAQQE